MEQVVVKIHLAGHCRGKKKILNDCCKPVHIAVARVNGKTIARQIHDLAGGELFRNEGEQRRCYAVRSSHGRTAKRN